MESFKKALVMGLISALAVFTASYFNLPVWVLFIAWTSYYLFGTSPKTAILILIQQFFGILIGMIIQFFGTHLSETLGMLGFPIVVFIVMFGVFYISKLKKMNNIPAYFLGMIVWFGSKSEINTSIIPILVITLILGYIFAWLNIKLSLFSSLKENTTHNKA